MEVAVFAIFAALAVVSAIVVVSHRNPVYSVMSLVVTLLSMAALFVMLGAPFLAAMLILVYTGAILVLFLFVLMLLNIGRESPSGGIAIGQKVGALVSAAIFGTVVVFLLWGRFVGFELGPLTEDYVQIQPLARALLSKYLLPFEMAGLLLLAAVTAATVLARRPTKDEGKRS
jgi:NADH-quinone oxidoreductase subunit J